jgi:hypothetical protein
MKPAVRRYLVELMSVITLYACALALSGALLRAWPEGAVRIPIALLPMLPALLIPVVCVRFLRQADELQQRIQLEALGFAFVGTAVITFGYGFLEVIGFPSPGAFAVWPLMGALWLAGLGLARWRYR